MPTSKQNPHIDRYSNPKARSFAQPMTLRFVWQDRKGEQDSSAFLLIHLPRHHRIPFRSARVTATDEHQSTYLLTRTIPNRNVSTLVSTFLQDTVWHFDRLEQLLAYSNISFDRRRNKRITLHTKHLHEFSKSFQIFVTDSYANLRQPPETNPNNERPRPYRPRDTVTRSPADDRTRT